MIEPSNYLLICMVIDLTNTARYYDPSDWKKQGIKYCKIACKGRDAVPDNVSVNCFVHEVLQFMERHKGSNRKCALVHCTHGYNRTGFMIVNYLVRSHGYSVTDALDVFADARPPGIYKPDYIDALFSFYHERRPKILTCPPTPEWKRPSELDLNGEAVSDREDDGVKIVEMENTVMTNDDVLGDEIPTDQQVLLQKICFTKLELGGANLHFPGSQPVSLDRSNLQLLRQRYYYATWKADGTRYMMLITLDGCYLIDRKFCFRRVQLRFPRRSSNQGPSDKTHHLTLLDGEMIIDTVPETGEQKRRYLVYDMMLLNGVSVTKLPFCERWKLIEKEVVEPRNSDVSNNHSYRYDMEPFRVRRKDFWMLSAVIKVLRDFIPKLSHEADGLIFQGWDDAYVFRTHKGLLKWKFPDMNSVDFLFEVGEENHQTLYLLDRKNRRQLQGAYVVFKGGEDPSEFNGKIMECSWNAQEEHWEYMRIRTDKETPNAWNTYTKVMQSIQDNITEEEVLDEITEIIRLPMYAERISRESQAHQHARRK
ncbi:mRNA-capping enzyme isoform X2 [Amborella trichopoda]|uniref:mRNA-capping enzyme isoform X2 n=1 Tax=Amborella trichopoda TaxID=13333 RepID=UPI0009C13277|nr:mRNA-capping enzyme isoform X2 [Amborella trichopoda]|eukprot:XP_020524223.1 mRNA-capping enzyme isoform X2 [Amborella trichopoda]